MWFACKRRVPWRDRIRGRWCSLAPRGLRRHCAADFLNRRAHHVLCVSDRLTFDDLIYQSILLHDLLHFMQVQVLGLLEHGARDPHALPGMARSEIASLNCPRGGWRFAAGSPRL